MAPTATTTTGQLRKKLAAMLDDVLAGKANLDEVAEANKTAGRINESLFAEATVMKRQHELKQEIAKLGAMEL